MWVCVGVCDTLYNTLTGYSPASCVSACHALPNTRPVHNLFTCCTCVDACHVLFTTCSRAVRVSQPVHVLYVCRCMSCPVHNLFTCCTLLMHVMSCSQPVHVLYVCRCMSCPVHNLFTCCTCVDACHVLFTTCSRAVRCRFMGAGICVYRWGGGGGKFDDRFVYVNTVDLSPLILLKT